MCLLAALCIIIGVVPGFFIDALAPATQLILGAHMPRQSEVPWLSIVPVAESRSSYNGLLVFLFVAFSASAAVFAIHGFASRRLRRAPLWDCGFPDPNPALQYTASSFSQPIRRVFGTLIFSAREHIEIPPPGDLSPARFRVSLRDYVWDIFYAPVAGVIGFTAERLNRFQFLTIRQYLGLVFVSLVSLLLVLAIWS